MVFTVRGGPDPFYTAQDGKPPIPRCDKGCDKGSYSFTAESTEGAGEIRSYTAEAFPGLLLDRVCTCGESSRYHRATAESAAILHSIKVGLLAIKKS